MGNKNTRKRAGTALYSIRSMSICKLKQDSSHWINEQGEDIHALKKTTKFQVL